jgi:branched-chain amino acid transport system ATP-binding protein
VGLNPLVVENVSKTFGGVQALRDINFSIEAGSRWVFIGPNGAGKTTLFRLISGIMKPSTGRIFLFGRDITRASSHHIAALGMACTFQITSLFPRLTLQENVLLSVMASHRCRYGLFRRLNSHAHLFARTRSILEQWGMHNKQHVPVHELSYGEQRQLEIVLALSQQPRILLLDEPTSGLSPAETGMVTSMLQALPRDITLLLIEHDMEVAFKLAEHFVVLHFGTIMAAGLPEEIKKDQRVQEAYMGQIQ